MRLADIHNGILEKASTAEELLDRPDWFDEDKFQRGREYFKKYCFGLLHSWMFSLMVGLSIRRFLVVLMATGQSHTSDKASRRYRDTLRHLMMWHLSGDMFKVGSEARRSLDQVREMHERAANLVANRTSHGSDQALVISQRDLAVVQCGFVGLAVVYPHNLALPTSLGDSGSAAYVYYWRCIAHVLGVRDAFNICRGPSLADTRQVCIDICEEILLPALRNPPPEFERMLDAYAAFVVRAAFPAFVPVTKTVMLNWAFSTMDRPELHRPMTALEHLTLRVLRCVMKLIAWLPCLHWYISGRVLLHIEKIFKRK